MRLKLKGFLDRLYWVSPWGRLRREKISRLYEAASARGLASTLEKVQAERDLYLYQRNEDLAAWVEVGIEADQQAYNMYAATRRERCEGTRS